MQTDEMALNELKSTIEQKNKTAYFLCRLFLLIYSIIGLNFILLNIFMGYISIEINPYTGVVGLSVGVIISLSLIASLVFAIITFANKEYKIVLANVSLIITTASIVAYVIFSMIVLLSVGEILAGYIPILTFLPLVAPALFVVIYSSVAGIYVTNLNKLEKQLATLESTL